MKTIYKILFLILIPSSVILSQNNNRWVLIGESETYTLYYDSETINHNSEYNTYEVWIKDVNLFPKIEKDGSWLDYTLSRWKLYCKSGKIQVLRSVVYFNDGIMQNNDIPQAIKEYVPGSMGEIIYLTMCK